MDEAKREKKKLNALYEEGFSKRPYIKREMLIKLASKQIIKDLRNCMIAPIAKVSVLILETQTTTLRLTPV